jgi:hypothetical protein
MIELHRQQYDHHYHLAADQDSCQYRLMDATELISGESAAVNLKQEELHFELTCSQGDATARICYGSSLISDVLVQFDCDEARKSHY